MRSRAPLTTAVLIVVASFAAAQTPLEQATEMYEAGDLEEARAILAAELESEPGSAAAHCLLGRISLDEEDADGAIDLLKQAVDLDGENSTYRGWLGRAYIVRLQSASFVEKGTLAGRAMEQLQKAIALDPANVQARITLAHYYLNAPAIAGGSARKAREQAVEIARHDPIEGNVLLAGIHEREKDHDKAIELYRRCIEARPEDTRCRYRLAMLHQGLEQYEQTFVLLEELLKIDPDAAAAMYQVGRTAALSRDRLDRGMECLRDYLAREVAPGHPGHGAAHWRLGMLHEHRGDVDRAREAYETAVRLDPDDEKFSQSLAALDQD